MPQVKLNWFLLNLINKRLDRNSFQGELTVI